ncbi:MAG TPA: DUF6489 family protein [Xanthomonadaceae bacterium]|jgi:hypothetical protein|nr:DUF6489 family protein [Xanthomonadaceae bacterium]
MKVAIDIDFTPVEARQFLGLPDVQPLQAAVLAKIEGRVMAEAERLSPEGLIKSWFSGGPQNADWFRDMFGGLLPGGGTKKKRISESGGPDQS